MVLGYAAIKPGEIVVDAYCGVGLFSIPLADAGAHVIGMESNEAACDDFAANAGDREDLELHEGAVEQILPALIAAGQRVDVVVLDPPHTGAGPEVAAPARGPRPVAARSTWRATRQRWPATPSTWLPLGFRLVEAQPVDLQPQTFRVETVALWQR